MKISFIGLGIMGSRMATNLVKNNIDLTVFNRSKGPVEQLVSLGASTANSVEETVKDSDIVITMLARPEAVQEVMLGKEGGIHHMKEGALWIDCSTVNPSFTRTCASEASQINIRFMDAPVAGTKPHAENGELVFFIGATEELHSEVDSILKFMGNKIVRIGDTGMGSSFKMLVNIMLAESMVVFSETVVLGQKLGMDRDFLLNVLPGLVVSAPFTKFKANNILANDFEPQFPLELMLKDMELVEKTAAEVGQELKLAGPTRELYSKAVSENFGKLDFAAIHKFLENQTD